VDRKAVTEIVNERVAAMENLGGSLANKIK
jgi:hypothetical protein